MAQLEHSAIFPCKWVNCRAEGRAAASFPDPYATGAWRAELQLRACRTSPPAWTREAGKERQRLRGSCTQQVSNYIMSVFNILLQLSSCSFQQHRSCPGAERGTQNLGFFDVRDQIFTDLSAWWGFLAREEEDFELQTIPGSQIEFKLWHPRVFILRWHRSHQRHIPSVELVQYMLSDIHWQGKTHHQNCSFSLIMCFTALLCCSGVLRIYINNLD